MPKLICFTLSTTNVIELHSSSTPKIQLNTVKQTFLWTKFGLDMVHCFLAKPERSLQNNITDPRPEQRCFFCLHPRVLAVQGRDGYGLAFTHVELRVQKTFGNTNTSPVFIVVANSWLLMLTNPTNKEPSTTNKISVARGCVCGGTRPPWAKSRRAMEMPRVLRPGNSAANAGVTWVFGRPQTGGSWKIKEPHKTAQDQGKVLYFFKTPRKDHEKGPGVPKTPYYCSTGARRSTCLWSD